MEPSKPSRPHQARHDELDVRPRRVMTGVYKDERLFTKIDAVEQRGTPVRHVHCVKTRLEQLVFEQDPYPSGERLIGLVERLTKPVLPSPDIRPGRDSWCHRQTKD